MKKPFGFLYDGDGDKSSSRLCFVFIHLLVATVLLYAINQHYMTPEIKDICLGILGIGWAGKVAQVYKEMGSAKPDSQ